ncbi:MAG: hypothetical protein IID41_13075, partial [Planctomycetes bacterium]|nr:hypothetical protein [Planctomycetota bacterium]
GFDDALAAKLSKRFGVAAEAYNPDPILNPQHHQGEHAGAFAAAVGLGIGHASEDKLQFNFLAPKKPIGVAERRRRQMPLAGAIVAGVLLIATLGYAVLVMPKQSKIKDLKRQITKLDRQLKTYNEVKSIVEQVDQWQAAQVVWPDELKLLAEAFPDQEMAFINGMKLVASNGEISFPIFAKNSQIVEDLEVDLNNLTRPGRRKDEKVRIFKTRTNRINNEGRDEDYPTDTKMFVRSARIADLQNKSKKGKKRG